MKPRHYAPLAAIIVGIMLWFTLSALRRHSPSPEELPKTNKTLPHSPQEPSPTSIQKPSDVLDASSQNTAADAPQATDALLTQIHDASVTYDPKQLPYLSGFLLHKNPTVREAARNGMIVLGDSAAAPLLREAAKLAATPQEAVALEEAAAYMELPSAREVKRTKKP